MAEWLQDKCWEAWRKVPKMGRMQGLQCRAPVGNRAHRAGDRAWAASGCADLCLPTHSSDVSVCPASLPSALLPTGCGAGPVHVPYLSTQPCD